MIKLIVVVALAFTLGASPIVRAKAVVVVKDGVAKIVTLVKTKV